MAHPKVYTADKNPQHVLIKALIKHGCNNIVLTWYSATTGRRGFVLECDEIPWARLGYDIEESLKAIPLLKRIEP